MNCSINVIEVKNFNDRSLWLKKYTYIPIRNCKNENRNTLFIAFLHARCYLFRKKPIRYSFIVI